MQLRYIEMNCNKGLGRPNEETSNLWKLLFSWLRELETYIQHSFKYIDQFFKIKITALALLLRKSKLPRRILRASGFRFRLSDRMFQLVVYCNY
jgi:transposase